MTYCSYGEKNQKWTNIWTNLPEKYFKPRPTCKRDCSPYVIVHGTHEVRYSDAGGTVENSQDMAVMPAPLCLDIAQVRYPRQHRTDSSELAGETKPSTLHIAQAAHAFWRQSNITEALTAKAAEDANSMS